MFIIFNKQKICSYLVALSTVIVLFVIATTNKTDDILQTSTNIEENVEKNDVITTNKNINVFDNISNY